MSESISGLSAVPDQDAPALAPESTGEYLGSRPWLAEVVGTVTRVDVFGEGKINAVFGVTGTNGSLVLKQAMPWIRVLPDWSLTVDRVEREAQFLEAWSVFNADRVPALLGFDTEAHVLAMENLADHVLWRIALHEGRANRVVAAAAGAMVARSAFFTSPFTRSADQHAHATSEASNAAMEAMMREVVFDIPFSIDARNTSDPHLAAWRERIQADAAVQAEVASLRWCFGTRREALLHGDLHTGSIMVAGDDLRVIDGEFSRYGPIAWDLGAQWGHLLLAAHSLSARGRVDEARAVQDLVEVCWQGFADELRSLWPERSDHAGGDDWLEVWLGETRELAVRFAGVEVLRRLVGVGGCEQLAGLDHDEQHAASDGVITTALHALKEGSWI